MAEIQDPASAAPEPSMEEILASIRKIIADDAPAATDAAAADVVELTQMVQDDGSVVDVKPAAKAAEEPPMPQQVTPPPAPAAKAAAPAAAAPPAAAKPAGDALVSDSAANAATSKLSSLANTVEIERLSAAPMTSTALGNGARTLEDMVMELMRPLLKQWLDQNLPGTVERLVQKEIERISRRAQD